MSGTTKQERNPLPLGRGGVNQIDRELNRQFPDPFKKETFAPVDPETLKAQILGNIAKAISEGRIPGSPKDYRVSFRKGSPVVKVKLYPKWDRKVTKYEDYPYHDAVNSVWKEVGCYAEGV
jgi:hypothetical protein